MNRTAPMTTQRLRVPGANLYYEVRGSGPVLLMMPGGPADARAFRLIAEPLASDYTVATYDPGGCRTAPWMAQSRTSGSWRSSPTTLTGC